MDITIALPDDLAGAAHDAGVPIEAVCRRAVRQSVERISAIHALPLAELDDDTAARFPGLTARFVTVLRLAGERAGDAAVGPADLLAAMVAEGDNLGARILTALRIDPGSLDVPATDERGPGFSTAAAVTLDAAATEAFGLGHNYVGCEHLLIALAGDRAGPIRQAVAAALAGYVHREAAAGN